MNFSSLAERAEIEGVSVLSLAECLAIAVARHKKDADGHLPTAVNLVREQLGFDINDSRDAEMWFEKFGLEGWEITRLQATIELGAKLQKNPGGEAEDMRNPEFVFEMMKELCIEEQEHFYILILDTKSRLKRKLLLHKGTLNASLVGVREIFRFAVREAANSIICVHNHPSGDPTPSPEDLAITQKIADLGGILGTPLDDHVIIGRNRFYSLRREHAFKYVGPDSV